MYLILLLSYMYIATISSLSGDNGEWFLLDKLICTQFLWLPHYFKLLSAFKMRVMEDKAVWRSGVSKGVIALGRLPDWSFSEANGHRHHH